MSSKPFLCFFFVSLFFSPSRAFSQAGSEPLFTFGVMTDVQYCDCDPAGTRHYRSSLRKLNEAVQTFNEQKVAFVTHLGDFIDHDFRSFDTLTVLVRQLNSPLYQVLGNHDFSVGPDELAKVPATLGMKNRYYSFFRQGWRFIVLDSNDLSTYGNAKGSKNEQASVAYLATLKAQNAPNAQPWNGGLSEKQLQWLKKELASAVRKKEQVIVLSHHPLMPENDRHNIWNDREVRTLLESYPNVFAYFNGHVHQKSHSTHHGIHYVTFKGIVEQEENGFAIVEVYSDRLKINGYATETSRVLQKL
ncbi:metallophosphoesterase [Larkinella bovis]|uniref:Metallophosphoesterase n=1 Tax=Larkinella bovis TaxID=683041 RepID=A0ABW0IDJ8_9BACT